MPQVSAFYSIQEINRPEAYRVHHNDNACPSGRKIPSWERRLGTGTYPLCEKCQPLDRKDANRPS